MLKIIRRIKYEKSPIGSFYKIDGKSFLVFAISQKYVHLINRHNQTIKIKLWDWYSSNQIRQNCENFKWDKYKKEIANEVIIGEQFRIPMIKRSILYHQHVRVLNKFITLKYHDCPYDCVDGAYEGLVANKIEDVCKTCHNFLGLPVPEQLGVCPCEIMTKELAIAMTIANVRSYNEHQRNLKLARKKKNKNIRSPYKRTPK